MTLGSAAGVCVVLEIRWDRGRRVLSGLAIVGKSEGLRTPIGARALPFFYRGSMLYYPFPLLSRKFLCLILSSLAESLNIVLD